MDLLARIEVDGVCLGGIRLSGVLRPKQVASVGVQTKTRAWAFRLGSSWSSGVSHARCKWLPATCSPYHTSIRARLATPDRSLLPVTSNILPTNLGLAANRAMRDWLRRVPYPFEVRMPNFPTSTSSSPTHRMRPSRDVPRRSQPYGLSPPAKTRMSPARHTNTPFGATRICNAWCDGERGMGNGEWRETTTIEIGRNICVICV